MKSSIPQIRNQKVIYPMLKTLKKTRGSATGFQRSFFCLIILLALFNLDTLLIIHSGGPKDHSDSQTLFVGPIQSIEIFIQEKDIQSLRRDSRRDVPAKVRVGTNVWESVAIHIKGAAGSSRPIDERPALTLNFDQFVPKQTFYGLDKLHLNNSVQDPSFACEAIASSIYLELGIPTARTTHAFVKLNDRDVGLYVLKEGYNGRFVRRHFPAEKDGNLYDGGFVQDIDQNLKLDWGRGVTNRSDLRTFAGAFDTPIEQRVSTLRRVLDVDQFLKTIAMQALLDDWDGYARNRNNYRLYITRPGRGFFIPHGMDQLFQDPNRSIRDGWNGYVVGRVLEVPEHKVRFREIMGQLATNQFRLENLTNRLHQVRRRLEVSMHETRTREWRSVNRNLDNLQQAIIARIGTIEREMNQWPAPAKPLPSGSKIAIKDWRPSVQLGSAILDRSPSPDSRANVVHLAAKGKGTIASFRSSVILPPGLYVLKASARANQLKAIGEAKASGAGIRVSGRARSTRLDGTTDWTTMTFGFTVGETSTVDLVMELRADSGEVWFDLDSISLTVQ